MNRGDLEIGSKIVRGGGLRRRITVALAWGAILTVAAQFEATAQTSEVHTGQDAEEMAADSVAPEGPADGLAAPRSAARTFLDACRAGDYEAAAGVLNLKRSPGGSRPDLGPVLARQLKVVLDRRLWVPVEQLSDAPEGNLDDGLPANLERIGAIATEVGSVDILLERVKEDEGARVWKFSAATVDRIPTLYEEIGYGRLGEILPETFFVRFLELELWQWIGLAVVALGAGLLSLLFTWFVRGIVRPFVRRTDNIWDDTLLELGARPFRLLVGVGFFFVGALFLGLAVPAQTIVHRIVLGIAVLAVTWLGVRLVDVASTAISKHLMEQNEIAAASVLPLGRKAAKTFLVLLAVVALLQNLGFNVTGLLAGLGVGGLAVALAAQKTVENLFGGVTLTSDQPVRVGDFCRFGDKVGTVEDVGLRSTRIRTLDRTLVTVPNAEFSQMQLENFAARDRIRLFAILGLRYETSPDQLRHVLAELRRLLRSHPRVLPDPARVRFVGFGAYSLDLEVFAYVSTSDWNEFLAIREDVLLRMMDVIGNSGTGFAFPSQTSYLARDTGMDEERARAAEAEVRAWRDSGRLPFPDFAPEALSEMEASLDYPPAGSASAGSAA